MQNQKRSRYLFYLWKQKSLAQIRGILLHKIAITIRKMTLRNHRSIGECNTIVSVYT